jgi:hypothetical protein
MRFLFKKAFHWRALVAFWLNLLVRTNGCSTGSAVWRRSKGAAMAGQRGAVQFPCAAQ